MTFRISPGVYPQTDDRTVRVGNFPTDIGVLCFASLRGPVGVQLVTDSVRFIERYGPPTPSNAATPGNGHDSANIFLDEAQQLYCRRVVNGAEYSLGAIVLSGGSGYGSTPDVTIPAPSSGTGVTAQAIAVVSGSQVTRIIITNPGSGYVVAPTVTIDSPGSPGITAMARAIITNGQVTDISLLSFLESTSNNTSDLEEFNYSDLAGNFTVVNGTTLIACFVSENPGEWANDLRIGINSFSRGISRITDLTFDGPVLATQSITYQLRGQSTPTSISYMTNNNTTLELFVDSLESLGLGIVGAVIDRTSGIEGVTVTAAGSGFTSQPTVTADPRMGSILLGQFDSATETISTVDVTAGGTGYTGAPAVTFGTPGTGATARAIVRNGSVVDVVVTDNGSGYTSAPTVSFFGGGGSGAAATAVVGTGGGTLLKIVIDNPGSGFANPPTLTVTGGGGSGATATALLNMNNNRVVRITDANPNNSTVFDTLEVTNPMGSTLVLPTIIPEITRNNILSDNTFNLQVFEGISTRSVENWPVSYTEQLDGYGNQTEIEYQVNEGPEVSSRIRAYVNPDIRNLEVNYSTLAVGELSGGENGTAPNDGHMVAGWNDFDNNQEYFINILINAGYTSAAVQQRMNRLAVSRRDCFPIIDMPSDRQQTQLAADYRNNELNINSSYGAMYTPDILILDEHTGRRRYVPPSGAVAAQFAYTSRTRELWFAAAGLQRGIVQRALGLRHNYNEGDRDILSQAQVNTIIRKAAAYPIWGEYTLQVQASDLQSAPVRRLLTHVEVAIASSLDFNVFDPNDEQTWLDIRTRINRFLLPIQRGRGLETFDVVCDERNNPGPIRSQRILNVEVYMTVVLPALYIRLTSILTPSSIEFEEIISLRNN